MNPWYWLAIGLLAVLLAVLAWLPSRRGAAEGGASSRLDNLDTVLDWQPQVTRILSSGERQAHALLARALPDHVILAQVPLARFLRVPTRHAYGEWLSRVGTLSADLLVCDRTSQVVAVVEVRSPREGQRSRKRHQRKARVLQAAGVRVLEWPESELPAPGAVRASVLPDSAAAPAVQGAATNGASPAQMPTTDIGTEDTEAGELAALREPPPSTWFDDFDSQPTTSAPTPPARKR